jgi:hypothetical protein
MKKLLLVAITLTLLSCEIEQESCPKVVNTGFKSINGIPYSYYSVLDNGETIYGANYKIGEYICN